MPDNQTPLIGPHAHGCPAAGLLVGMNLLLDRLDGIALTSALHVLAQCLKAEERAAAQVSHHCFGPKW